MILKKEIEYYFDRLWPLNRSLTGEGNRETLRILSEIVDFKIIEIPSGQKVFDWNVPNEWHLKEAWIKDSNGNTVIDFKNNNLHILGYSISFHSKLSKKELEPHIYTLPENPDWIPYRTSYYSPRWGFCLSKNQFDALREDELYEVFIDAEHNPKGSMTIGEAILPGETNEEIFFSTYICHPSMANNELSGPLITSFIYQKLKKIKKRRYTYRFVYLPETIGAISYLSMKGKELKSNVISGFVVTTAGDSGKYTLKLSRQENTLCDRASKLVLNQDIGSSNYITEAFSPIGSDERQYSSPGFNLPVCSIMRTRYGKYQEYHTSADNKDFISFSAMEETIDKYLDVINLMEQNYIYKNQMPYGEIQLGKRGLWSTIGGKTSRTIRTECIAWLLNLSDGQHDIIDIANRSQLPYNEILDVVADLLKEGLIKKI